MTPDPLQGRTVLVVGEYRQTITVVRSLARAGMRVTLATPDPDADTRWSRAVAGWLPLDWPSDERFADQIEALLRREPHDVVFLVGEGPLRRFLPNAARLEPLATWVQPPTPAIRACFDKSALYRLLPSLGVPSMAWHPYEGADAWRASAAAMGYPVVVKRLDSSADVRGRKAFICGSPEELEAFLANLAQERRPEQLLLQKYQRGVRHNCHIAACGGRILAYFQQKVLRTDETDDTGIGVAGVSVEPDPRLRECCEAIVRAVGYEGIGCIQFLVDEATGEMGFLEFNARMDSTAALPYRLGYDYPVLGVRIALHRAGKIASPRAVEARYPSGVTYHWLLGDFWAWVSAARARRAPPARLARWALHMGWLAVTSHHLTFDWRDPWPTLRMHARELCHRVRQRWQRAARAQPAAGD